MLICCNSVLYVCMQTFVLKISIVKAKYYNKFILKAHTFCDNIEKFNVKLLITFEHHKSKGLP